MDIVSEVNPIDGAEDLYKELALQILKRFLLEKHKEYCRNYYQNNREKLIQANMRHFKENYHTISQTERYKQTAKKFNHKYYHERDEETKKAANRKYYLAKRAKIIERRRLEEPLDQHQDDDKKKRGRPRMEL